MSDSDNKSRLLLVRHTESAWNKLNVFTGWVDVPLSENGKTHARAVGQALRGKFAIDKAYTSGLVRAQQTLDLVMEGAGIAPGGIPVVQDWHLNERFYGNWQGKNKDQTVEKYGKDAVMAVRRGYAARPPGGESLEDTTERVLPYFAEVMEPELAQGLTLLVAAHGNSLRALVKKLDSLSDEAVPHVEIANGELLVYRREADGVVCARTRSGRGIGFMHNTENDFAAFSAALHTDAPHFFAGNGEPVWVARAPGRLDVMGGIADYSGCLVAEMPIAQAAVVGAQRDNTLAGAVVVRSLNAQSEHLTPEVVLPAELFVNPVSLLRHLRDSLPGDRWAGYAAGCFGLLRAEGLIDKGVGARLLVRSDVPLGAGVSSSAALEVASMRALCAAFGVTLDGLALARLCQRVENDVMDAPCGVMDQVTSALGQAGSLLQILCQPYQVQGPLAVPAGWSVFGIDSGVKHSVAGNAYTRVRVAAFMGYKIISDHAGNGFGGYLCNVSPDEYHAFLPDGLPETLNGAAFLGKHNGIFDTVTTVDPAATYPVRAATEHAIFEMVRVRRFVECLQNGSDAEMHVAGEQMAGSHGSYSACGVGSLETDLLVRLALENGAVSAKITGGGSGGTVCVLCKADKENALAALLTKQYQTQTGLSPRLIQGTSPGAMATPVRRL